MTMQQIEFCARAVIRHMDGDTRQASSYMAQAARIDPMRCLCGARMVQCRYMRKRCTICTRCGILWWNGEAERKCLTGRVKTA